MYRSDSRDKVDYSFADSKYPTIDDFSGFIPFPKTKTDYY